MKYIQFINPDKRYNINLIKIAREKSIPLAKEPFFKKKIKTTSDGHSRCRYINPETNKRCKNSLGIYPKFCHTHTVLIENLYLDESKIKNAGLGLFSGPFGIQKNQIIGKYSSPQNYLPSHLHDRRCQKDKNCYQYVFCDNNKCWDASDIRSTLTRYINDARGSEFRNNCYFEIINKDIYVISSRNIKPHKELFISYGGNYWN
jgi:hypothetical protein